MLSSGSLGYIRSKIQTGKLACAMKYMTTTESPLQFYNGLPTLSQIEMFVWINEEGQKARGNSIHLVQM